MKKAIFCIIVFLSLPVWAIDYNDAEDTAFESVTEAAETGYRTDMKPCVAGHTYIVKTYENNYAKFVVRSISEK